MNTKMDDYNKERDDLRTEVVKALQLNDSVFKKLHKMYGMAYDLQKGGTTLIAEGYDGTNKDEVINSIINKELITPYVGFNLQKGTAKLVIVDGEDVNKWVNQLNGIQKEMIDHSTATQSYVQRTLTENI
ncbi:hypothetical protein HYO65_gp062 [Tenacibaculum phage PTm1]|uniref:Uncharacterized protein n=2 Tax=Shirahamavirus PTm1 TaxID=2846435 RepID=A0A5S9HXD5_9CAUD|nr:hypothetical protein HYO65_gp062 [Tenacibaculum phage PTm1]BBI90454.1 hypothetical protein [Tenacibaculum phage PTm1]BBI90762.1 hypothetical protein [Tenacibaculum phage PTm5]